MTVHYKLSLSALPVNLNSLNKTANSPFTDEEDENELLLPASAANRYTRKYGQTSCPTAVINNSLLELPSEKKFTKKYVAFDVTAEQKPKTTSVCAGQQSTLSDVLQLGSSSWSHHANDNKRSMRKASRQLRNSVVTFVDEHHGWRRFLGIMFVVAGDTTVTIEHVASIFLVADFDAQRVALMRFAFVPLVMLPFLLYKRTNPFSFDKVWRQNGWLLVLRGVLGGAIFMLKVYAFAKLPLGDATTIMSSAQIFLGLLARVVTREHCDSMNFLTAFLALCGCMLISRPESLFSFFGAVNDAQVHTNVIPNSDRLYGSAAAVLSSLGHVIVCQVLSRLRKVEPKIIIFHFGIIGWLTSLAAVAILPSQVKQWSAATLLPHTISHGLYLGVIAVANNLTLMLFTLAARCESPSVIALMVGPDVLLAFVAQFIFFGIVPHALSILGALLIVSSVLGTVLKKYRQSHQHQRRLRELALEQQQQQSNKLSLNTKPTIILQEEC